MSLIASPARLVGLAVLLVLSFPFHEARAQVPDTINIADAGPTRTINFNEAIRIALDENTTLKRASSAARRSEIQVSSARMNFFPTVGLSSGGQRSFGRSFSTEEGGIVNETSDFFTVNTDASINLFNGFGDVARLDQAQLNAQASDLSLERTRQDVVFQVMNDYLALIESQELIGVRQEELEARRQQLRRVEEEVEVGARPTSDLYQQQVQVAQAEQQLLTAERQVQLNKTALIQTLQLEPFGNYTFEAPPIDEGAISTPTYDINQLLRQAFNRRVDLRAQQLEVQAAQEGIQVARSGYYPSINLSLGYGSNWSSTAQLPVPGTGTDPQLVQLPTSDGETVPYFVPGTGTNPNFITPGFLDQLDNRRGGSITLSLNVPLFDRLQTKHQVDQAQVDLATARYALQDQRQQVALQVRQAYLDYQNAQKRLEVARTQVRAAERAREAAQERYNLGAAPFVELAQANADYVSAASERVQARYSLIFQKKLIDYYLGVLDTSAPLLQ